MRIAHFSDIHVGCLPRTAACLFDKRILGIGNHLLRRRGLFKLDYVDRALDRLRDLRPDWVVCTGDLTAVGAPAEFEAACGLLQPFLDLFGDRFLVVPGNHDAYVRDARCRQALANALEQLNRGRFGIDRPAALIRARALEFVLVNEALPTPCHLSSGRIPAAAREWLADTLGRPAADGTKRILVGHFPLRDRNGVPLSRRRGLVGADFLYEALGNRTLDVSLCGHDHTAYARRDASGALEVCAGSLTAHGLINVLDINTVSGRVRQFWVDVVDDGPPSPAGPDLAPLPVLDGGIRP